MDGWMEKAIDRDKEKNRDRDGDSNHRKFRSQTSDKDRCSNSGGSSQRRDTIRRKKIKVAEKVKKNRNALCFSNVFWLRRVEKVACQSSGCGAIWGDEK